MSDQEPVPDTIEELRREVEILKLEIQILQKNLRIEEIARALDVDYAKQEARDEIRKLCEMRINDLEKQIVLARVMTGFVKSIGEWLEKPVRKE